MSKLIEKTLLTLFLLAGVVGFIYLEVYLVIKIKYAVDTLSTLDHLYNLPKTTCKLVMPFSYQYENGRGYTKAEYRDLSKNFTSATLFYPSFGTTSEFNADKWAISIPLEFDCWIYSTSEVINTQFDGSKYDKMRDGAILGFIFALIPLIGFICCSTCVLYSCVVELKKVRPTRIYHSSSSVDYTPLEIESS